MTLLFQTCVSFEAFLPLLQHRLLSVLSLDSTDRSCDSIDNCDIYFQKPIQYNVYCLWLIFCNNYLCILKYTEYVIIKCLNLIYQISMFKRLWQHRQFVYSEMKICLCCHKIVLTFECNVYYIEEISNRSIMTIVARKLIGVEHLQYLKRTFNITAFWTGNVCAVTKLYQCHHRNVQVLSLFSNEINLTDYYIETRAWIYDCRYELYNT